MTDSNKPCKHQQNKSSKNCFAEDFSEHMSNTMAFLAWRSLPCLNPFSEVPPQSHSETAQDKHNEDLPLHPTQHHCVLYKSTPYNFTSHQFPFQVLNTNIPDCIDQASTYRAFHSAFSLKASAQVVELHESDFTELDVLELRRALNYSLPPHNTLSI